MWDMSREQHSEYEGPALPIFKFLPKGTEHWWVRILWEPLFVYCTTFTLSNMRILQPSASRYLYLGAILLAVKSYIEWYQLWEWTRKILDSRFVAPIITKLAEDKATDAELATVHLAGFPRNIDPALRQSAIAQIARSYGQDVPTASTSQTVASANPSGEPKLALSKAAIRNIFFAFGFISTLSAVMYFVDGVKEAATQVKQAVATPASVTGTWRGVGQLPKAGNTILTLDLSDANGVVIGTVKKELHVPGRNPQSDLGRITGRSSDGTATLHESRMQGQSPYSSWCSMERLTLTPQGTRAMTARWQDPPCQGGSLVLEKIR